MKVGTKLVLNAEKNHEAIKELLRLSREGTIKVEDFYRGVKLLEAYKLTNNDKVLQFITRNPNNITIDSAKFRIMACQEAGEISEDYARRMLESLEEECTDYAKLEIGLGRRAYFGVEEVLAHEFKKNEQAHGFATAMELHTSMYSEEIDNKLITIEDVVGCGIAKEAYMQATMRQRAELMSAINENTFFANRLKDYLVKAGLIDEDFSAQTDNTQEL